MRLTIIADDLAVYVDGKACQNLDIVSNLDPEIHAIQWDGSRGEIEYRSKTCPDCGGVSKKPNETFTDVSVYQPYVDAFNEAVAAEAAAQEKARLANAS